MVLKYTSKRPDEELDGLQELEAHFKGHQPDDVVVVAVVTGHTVVENVSDGQRTASVRIKQVEAMSGDAAATARKLLSEAYVKRTGNSPLPFEEEAPMLALIEGGDSE